MIIEYFSEGNGSEYNWIVAACMRCWCLCPCACLTAAGITHSMQSVCKSPSTEKKNQIATFIYFITVESTSAFFPFSKTKGMSETAKINSRLFSYVHVGCWTACWCVFVRAIFLVTCGSVKKQIVLFCQQLYRRMRRTHSHAMNHNRTTNSVRQCECSGLAVGALARVYRITMRY